MEPRLRKQLERVDQRQAAAQKERASSFLWGMAAAGMAIVLLAREGLTTLQLIIVLAAALALVLVARVWVGGRRRDPLEVARDVERERGELDSSLLAAAELEPDLPDGRYGFLAKRLIDKVLLDARKSDWSEAVVPARELGTARGVHAGFAVLFLVLLLLGLQNRGVAAGPAGGEATVAAGGSPEVVTEFTVDVQPGDAEIERGRGALITAAFPLAHAPANATLHVAMGDAVAEQPMRRSLDDPIYALRLPAVTHDTTYQVRWPGGATREYQLRVYDLPRLERADLLLRFPAYAGMEDRLVEDTRRATVPEGTEIAFKLTLNKPVNEAWLRDREGTFELPLATSPDGARMVEGSLVLTRGLRLELDLLDGDGRENASKPRFVLNATDNTRPTLALTGGRDKVVSPLEELDLDAKLSDDFGLRRYGISYRLGGGDETVVVLGEGAEGEVHVAHRIAFEELGAEAKDLLSYHFWAEDLGTDGAPRRTTSDLFLAEVRPFEQIFRESEGQPGGQQEQQQQDQQQQGQQQQGQQGAMQLVQMQKDILVGTWNAIRAHADGNMTTQEDSEVLLDAQSTARENLETLGGAAELLGVDGVEESLERVRLAMDQAIVHLERAVDGDALGLDDGVPFTQGALQGLLELQQAEFDVARQQNQQQQQGGQQGGQQQGQPSVSQQQLDNLELDNRENRYETQRQAGQPSLQEQAAQETQEALDRLKELARRQEDLNQRLRELQSEMELAQTEEEREELRRRLERLQEDQEELLRDTDELSQQMEDASSARLSEQQEQLEQTRENQRRASEALEEGRVAEALTEGARAETDLENLEQELRDAAGEQFDQRARDLVREARRLEQEQERLAEELEDLNEQERPSLREDPTRGELEEALEGQQDDLNELLTDLEETVQDAEITEPLLAEGLFDALERARGEDVEDAIESMRDLLEQGFPEEAEREQGRAQDGLSDLRQDIEDAAESVLGSGTEALERAQEELERLAEELEAEVNRGRGEPREGADQDGEPREGQPGEGERTAENQEGQPGEGQPQEGQPGERTALEGQPQEGEPQEGQPQEGQPQEGQPGGQQPGQGQPGERTAQDQEGQPRGGDRERRSLDGPDPDRPETAGGRGGGGGRYENVAPLTGDDFRDWSDRLRDVEEMLDDPDLAAEAARLRSRARATREEAKRHSEEPDWELVDEKILRPLGELQQEVAAELRRRRAEDEDVPIDRDPVPPGSEEWTRKYFESLGRGKEK